jgi:hypothetical protein
MARGDGGDEEEVRSGSGEQEKGKTTSPKQQSGNSPPEGDLKEWIVSWEENDPDK